MRQRHEEIASLEAEIEELAEAAERCWKIGLAAKVALAAGLLLLLFLATGFLRLGPEALVLGLGSTLGGIALAGSNRSSRNVILASIRAREERRAELIETLAFQAVEDG